jgi:hypothetical protein
LARVQRFCQDINDALAMTSVRRKLENMGGGGPYIFKVHGALSHHIGSLLSVLINILYMLSFTSMTLKMPSTIEWKTKIIEVWTEQDMLYRNHHGITLYKSA